MLRVREDGGPRLSAIGGRRQVAGLWVRGEPPTTGMTLARTTRQLHVVQCARAPKRRARARNAGHCAEAQGVAKAWRKRRALLSVESTCSLTAARQSRRGRCLPRLLEADMARRPFVCLVGVARVGYGAHRMSRAACRHRAPAGHRRKSQAAQELEESHQGHSNDLGAPQTAQVPI